MLGGNRSGFPLWRLDVRPWGRNLWRKGWNLITHPSTPSHTHTVQEWKRKVNLNRNMNIFLGKEKKVWVFIGLDQGWAPRPAGNPPRGGGGGPPPRPALWGWGRGGSPPRPVKMIETAGKLWGKIKARISTFSNRGNQ